MAKKSASQIKRMKDRAAARGEEYVPPLPVETKSTTPPKKPDDESTQIESKADDLKRKVAARLQKELKEIESNTELKSKDRRTAKRKAEGLATEMTGCPAAELLEWYDKSNKQVKLASTNKKKKIDLSKDKNEIDSEVDVTKRKAAEQLQNALKKIDEDKELKSKDRRAAKRKAEAIATEATGCTPADLLEWLEKQPAPQEQRTSKQPKNKAKSTITTTNPYVVFIGQLSYETTKQDLFAHIQKELKDVISVTEKNLSIRLLTDAKTGKSRGMAFCELETPEHLYACLKLHHTYLNGRRINVERTTGGKKDSQARKERLAQMRNEQSQYMEKIVKDIYNEYKSTGEIIDGELDEGVLALCTRHSATVVAAAFEKYLESGGRNKDNSSAYMSHLLTKLSVEGIYDTKKVADQQEQSLERPTKRPRRMQK